MPKSIIKLVYKREFFDLSEMKPGAKQITTIVADGTITQKEYMPGSRNSQLKKLLQNTRQ